jgi:mannosyl-3-phosphoglycerate phosphatase
MKSPSNFREHYQGFGDWSVEEVSQHTGLPSESATNAKQRQFSEPGLWSGSEAELADFITYLSQQGIHARKGGRFLTLSLGATKGQRVKDIINSYASNFSSLMSIALGDAPNDVEMLEATDYGVIITNPHSTPLPELARETEGRISRSELPAPHGWNAAVLSFFDRLQLNS